MRDKDKEKEPTLNHIIYRQGKAKKHAMLSTSYLWIN